MRRAARVDANHAQIVEAYRLMGCSFLSLAPLGRGAPDGAVGWAGLTDLVEIKDGAKPKSAQALTPDQKKFWNTWKGGVRLIDNLNAVAEHVTAMRERHRKLCG